MSINISASAVGNSKRPVWLFLAIDSIIDTLLGSLVNAPPVPTIYLTCDKSLPSARDDLPEGP